jgi:hypothetical protein
LEDTVAFLMRRPINSKGYRAANFIQLSEALATTGAAKLQQAMYGHAALGRPRTVLE